MALQRTYKKPLPEITHQSRPFWQACNQHNLLVQQCGNCDRYHLPPAELSPCCSAPLRWVRASGRGQVHTFTILHVAYNPAFKDDLPYNVSIIELEEGPLLLSNVVNCANAELHIGMPVRVVFENVTPEQALPRFEPDR